MENVSLSSNLVNATVQYLATKPYAEVANLISAMQKEVEGNGKLAESTTKQEQLNG